LFAYFQKKPGESIIWTYYYLVLMLLTGCVGQVPSPTCTPQQPTVYPSQTIVLPSSTPMLPTPYPSNTPTFGPSPTSTLLPPLEDSTWISKPIMIEGAIINTDPESPFQYTPFFILYGDGKLIKRTCETGECRYLQAQLERESLCYVFNTVNRSGFLDADPLGFSVPTGTGTQIRLKAQVYKSNEVQIPDLDRWVQTTNWYDTYSGCQNCIDAPEIDPAYIDFYQLLTTYDETGMTGAAFDRLALWITQPFITGTPQPWAEDLIALSALMEASSCPNKSQHQAVILEGQMAFTAASFLSNSSAQIPIFTDGIITLQINSRWLLPFEMPKTCQAEAGMFPPSDAAVVIWQCESGIGSIPTPTTTITLTPTKTSTPMQ